MSTPCLSVCCARGAQFRSDIRMPAPAPAALPSVRLRRRRYGRACLLIRSTGKYVYIHTYPRRASCSGGQPTLPCNAMLQNPRFHTHALILRPPAPRYITKSNTRLPYPHTASRSLNPLFSSTSRPSPRPHPPHQHPHPPYSCSSPSSRYQSTSS